MCTIGCICNAPGARQWTFKQCDLVEPTLFLEPEVEEGDDGIRYVAFRREGSNGPWAGFNDCGVGLVAADAYLEDDDEVNPEGQLPADLLEAYTQVLEECATLEEAVELMRAFYEASRPADIVLLTGPEGAVLVESSPSHGVQLTAVGDGPLVCTNHFLSLPGGVTPGENPSSHLRLARAEEILEEAPDAGGVARLLTDQAYGPTTDSLCRVARDDDEYSTQAAVAWVTRADGRVDCAYVLNGNAAEKRFTVWRDVFGDGELDEEAAVAGDDAWRSLGGEPGVF
jgi:hypothetical protein